MPSPRNDNSLVSRSLGEAPVMLLRAQYKKHKFTPHHHAEAVVAFVLSGEEWFEIGDEQIQGKAGSIVFIDPYETHRGWADSAGVTDYRAIHLPAELFEKMLGAKPHFKTRSLKSDAFVSQLSGWHDALSDLNKASAWKDVLNLLLCSLEEHVEAACRNETDIKNSVAELAREAILSNIDRPDRIQDLATQLQVSDSYLHRVFKKRYGLSPHRLLVQARALAALRLIRSGSNKTEAAYATGFSDQSHLTKTFKAIFGVTPGQCLADHGAGV